MSNSQISILSSPKKEKPIINFKYPMQLQTSDKINQTSEVLAQKSPQQNKYKNQSLLQNLHKQQYFSQKQLNVSENKRYETNSMKTVLVNQTFSEVNHAPHSFENKNLKIDTNKNVTIQNGQCILPSQQQLCQICSKRKPSYLVQELHKQCCSNCAIEQMKNGKNVTRLQLFKIRVTEPKAKIQGQETYKDKMLRFIQKAKKQEQKIKYLKSHDLNIENEETIKQFFHQKKRMIRLHYEKLREVITISIQKDLKEIKQRQEQSLASYAEIKEKMSQSKINLQKFIKELESRISTIQKKQNELFGQFYQENLQKCGRILKQIQSRVWQRIQQYNQKRKWVKNCFNQKLNEYFYQPSVYMITKTIQRRGQPIINPLFSFRDQRQLSCK